MAAGKPGILKRPFMKARENLATLVKSPKEFGKRIMHDIRYKTVDPSKIVGGKIKNNPLRRIATGQTHRNVQQLGFRNGQAVIKRTAAGQLGQAAMGAGVGMGAIDFATNSTDEQGNKRGLGNRLVRATGEAAKWTIAPGLAMGWEVGSLGAGMLKTKQKNSFEQRARIATQKT
ncbi:MAG: hypothetical protein H8E12_16970 [Rhodobacteraceae bacterium]|nr:hypothetical protein [Paracoccaceae bacterium]